MTHASGLLWLASLSLAACASTTPNGLTGTTNPKTATPPAATDPPQATYSPEVEQRIDRILHGLLPDTGRAKKFGPPAELAARMRYYHTPGVSIAVIHDGKLEWARGFGVRDVTTKRPMTADTMLQAGSISKPTFALAVMRLVAQAKLDLDADIHQYLKTWKVPAEGDWRPMITLRELLSHSAGLTVHGFQGYRSDEPLPTLRQILDGTEPANSPPVVVNILPETSFRYAGGGTTVAQLAVMDHLGRAFPEIMQDLVLGPLGMTHSTYAQPLPDKLHGSAATAHPWKGEAIPGKWHTYPEMAAAGLWTTPSDLCQAGLELQKAIEGTSSFLPKKIAEEMLTRQMGDVGIGFFLVGNGTHTRFGHGGWDEGFVAQATFYRNKAIGAVVMVNSNEGQPLLMEIERAIAREYGWPEYFPEEKKRMNVEVAALEPLLGEYETDKGTKIVVQRDGNDLLLVLGKQPALRLVPYETGKFFAPNLELEVVFKTNDKQPAESLSLQQNHGSVDAKRKLGGPLDKRR